MTSLPTIGLASWSLSRSGEVRATGSHVALAGDGHESEVPLDDLVDQLSRSGGDPYGLAEPPRFATFQRPNRFAYGPHEVNATHPEPKLAFAIAHDIDVALASAPSEERRRMALEVTVFTEVKACAWCGNLPLTSGGAPHVDVEGRPLYRLGSWDTFVSWAWATGLGDVALRLRYTFDRAGRRDGAVHGPPPEVQAPSGALKPLFAALRASGRLDPVRTWGLAAERIEALEAELGPLPSAYKALLAELGGAVSGTFLNHLDLDPARLAERRLWGQGMGLPESALPFAAYDDVDVYALDRSGDPDDPPVIVASHHCAPRRVAPSLTAFLAAEAGEVEWPAESSPGE